MLPVCSWRCCLHWIGRRLRVRFLKFVAFTPTRTVATFASHPATNTEVELVKKREKLWSCNATMTNCRNWTSVRAPKRTGRGQIVELQKIETTLASSRACLAAAAAISDCLQNIKIAFIWNWNWNSLFSPRGTKDGQFPIDRFLQIYEHRSLEYCFWIWMILKWCRV